MSNYERRKVKDVKRGPYDLNRYSAPSRQVMAEKNQLKRFSAPTKEKSAMSNLKSEDKRRKSRATKKSKIGKSITQTNEEKEKKKDDKEKDKEKTRKDNDDTIPSTENSEEKRIRKGKNKEMISLEPGDEVTSLNNKYTVKRKLGEGGFGAVYQVKAKTKPVQSSTRAFALKCEARGPRCPDRLKIEVAVLSLITNCPDKVKEHFAMMVDRGQTPDFVFVVMSLVGPSLQTIRDNILHKEFSNTTAFRISIESLEAIKHLHTEVGFIHRDIKPSNFTVGLGMDFVKIILIDFGIARKINNKDNVIRLPRKEVKFLGTVRFASRKCHQHEEQGRQGDLESWFYMCCDVYNQHVLPWRRVKERDLIFALKNDLRENDGNHKMFRENVPKEFRDVMIYVDKLGYEDVPDYAYLKEFMEKIAIKNNVDLTGNFDWFVFGPPPRCDSE